MSTLSSAPSTNAALANRVDPKQLQKQHDKLDHVPADKYEVHGSVHLGPAPDVKPSSLLQQPQYQSHQHSELNMHGAQQLQGGDITVQSNVHSDITRTDTLKTSQQIQDLLNRLSTTTQQIDAYSKRRSEEISRETNDKIQGIITNTKREQDALLKDANDRSLEIENVYTLKLKAFIQELDAAKAANLASLERDLVLRQEGLLQGAREQMDLVYDQANREKMRILQQAQLQAGMKTEEIAEQVKQLGAAELEKAMNSTTTTVITTNTQANTAALAHDIDKLTVTESRERTTVSHMGEPRNMPSRV